MPFTQTLEKVLLVLKVLFWLVLLATAIVGLKFTVQATNLMMDRLEAGEPPFAIGRIAEPLDTNAVVGRIIGSIEQVSEEPLD